MPGDIIRLAAGDMVPADVWVLSAKDLFLNQVAPTGEALPAEKKSAPAPADVHNPLELPNLCFLGSNVESGSATAVVLYTGNRTYFGSLAASIVGQRQLTGFDLGINKFTRKGIRSAEASAPRFAAGASSTGSFNTNEATRAATLQKMQSGFQSSASGNAMPARCLRMERDTAMLRERHETRAAATLRRHTVRLSKSILRTME
ncbi:MAG TPA: hypothetical protein VGR78_10670 [Verrucomicrobiae bacterium]|jgi:magnesium-transporting ATPase (P-type)|nr:hypothetical protein [Verrucomicrobiae bacterium]